MRIANVAGRLKLVDPKGDRCVDVASESGGSFELPDVYDRWSEFIGWTGEKDRTASATEAFDPTRAGPPSPAPRQVFAVALNYRAHAAESGLSAPEESPLFFTKYVSAFSGAHTKVAIPAGGNVDWECELVAIVGKEASQVPSGRGWEFVAGITVGQDISERRLQRSGPMPQYSLGKSHAGFAPQGPVLVTRDELVDPDDLEICCYVNDRPMQQDRTSHMIFPVPALVEYLSRVVTLYPGDVIFTGTPPGVGMGRKPQVFLKPGDVLVSRIEGIGEIVQQFVSGS